MFKSVVAAIVRQGQPTARQFTSSAVGAGGHVVRRAALLFPSAAAGLYASTSEEAGQVIYKATVVPVRLFRDARFVVATIADYSWSLRGLEGEERDKAREECHQRGADRLLGLCFSLGGIYIKLGQHLGMLDHLLPPQYVLTMRAHMLDRCPVSSWPQVRKTIEEDLGAPLESLYSEFSPTPVASASLAQVHAARDAHTGERVAVKVQHRGLRDTSAIDLEVIETLVKFVKWLKSDVDYTWLVNEAKENLPQELDFKLEASNAQRCAELLASREAPRAIRGRVVVPRIDLGKTSHRVLTMEFIDGTKVTDKAGLAALGTPPSALAKLISRTFNAMIFRWGWVHADPHAANMLVRKAPPGSNATWQLVLLDHGLYRELDNTFRLEYASLWRSLIFGDIDGIRSSATAMNAGGAVPLFAGMLTQRPWREVASRRRGTDRLKLKYTSHEREEIQQYAGQYADEISKLLGRLPRELLLLLKTNDCLRAVDAELGAGVNNFVETARACGAALARGSEQRRRGWLGRFVGSVRMELKLMQLQIVAMVAPLIEKLPLGAAKGEIDEEQIIVVTL